MMRGIAYSDTEQVFRNLRSIVHRILSHPLCPNTNLKQSPAGVLLTYSCCDSFFGGAGAELELVTVEEHEFYMGRTPR